MTPRFHAFWAINAPLDQTRLRRQLEQFRAHGFDGVVWHPRFYPGEPPYLGGRYLAEVSAVILHAKSLGLAFWLYDEDGCRPFVWLRGGFRVKSGTPFVAGPNQTVKTDGPLALHPGTAALPADLVAGGFPFLREPLVVAGEITLSAAGSRLRLDGVAADAVRLAIDGRDLGWAWRAAGEIVFPAALAAGTHRLRLELAPNTFNAFGPHHYYGGDWPAVSPDQIRGRRNFADPADAPIRTHVAAWHFRRFELPRSLSIYAA